MVIDKVRKVRVRRLASPRLPPHPPELTAWHEVRAPALNHAISLVLEHLAFNGVVPSLELVRHHHHLHLLEYALPRVGLEVALSEELGDWSLSVGSWLLFVSQACLNAGMAMHSNSTLRPRHIYIQPQAFAEASHLIGSVGGDQTQA